MRIQKALARARKNRRGFTLVELMIVVAIIGVLAALAIYGVSKYVANAKTAEARNVLGDIAKSGVTHWDGEKWANAATMSAGEERGGAHVFCESATASVPTAPPAGEKYQSSPGDWSTDTWQCLNFSVTGPQYFAYNYETSGTGTTGDSFTATANGNLDGDADLSTFTLAAAILEENGALMATIAPAIGEVDPSE